VLVDDLTTWDYWWEFNKDPFLRLKDEVNTGGAQTGDPDFHINSARRAGARDSAKPTENQIVGTVLPALKHAIDATKNRDIVSSCMVALAKAGKDHPDFRLVDVFAPQLERDDQEIRETAALSIGIAAIAGEREVELLVSLVADDARGREACKRYDVDERTRSFAAYGLGVMAHATTLLPVKQKAFAALRPLVDDTRASGRQLKVAAIHAISLLHLDAAMPREAALLEQVLDCLEHYYLTELGVSEHLMQAHCPTAIAKLVGRDHGKAEHYRALFAKELLGKVSAQRTSDDLARSCVLALGRLCRPVDDDKSADARYCDLLRELARDHKDEQTRNFAVLALGQIGGARNHDVLLDGFDKARKTTAKPWFALALGVQAFHEFAAQKGLGVEPLRDRKIGEALLDAIKQTKSPNLAPALAIALGLCHYEDAADTLREMLPGNLANEDLAGYLCIGLALMEDRKSIPDLQQVLARSTRRHGLFQQAAIALGRLGDKTAAEDLQRRLAEADNNLAKLSAIASALGFIGDRRSITPLVKMLGDTSLNDLSRAFAAVALGGIADKELLPWNSKISVDTNYRAAVETLTNRQSGILDIL
jgi:HEAT repeat protein